METLIDPMHAEKSKRLNKNCNPLKPTTSVHCYFNVLSKNILSSFRHSFFNRISLTLFVCMTKVNAIRMKKIGMAKLTEAAMHSRAFIRT